MVIESHPAGDENGSISLRQSSIRRSPRLVLVPLAVLLQEHEARSRSAQVALAEIKSDLIVLQALPWQVENRRYGTPSQIRQQMADYERRIDDRLESLLRSSPPSSLASAPRALRANYASLDPIYTSGLRAGGWSDPISTLRISSVQTTTVMNAYGRLDKAAKVYAHRATAAERISRVGAVGAIVALLSGFLFYFRRAEKTRATLTQQAATDALTGLANRAAFTHGIAAELTGPLQSRAAVLFIDVDDFKDVNDVFGHRGGDAVLREVAARVERYTRAGDICARLGGDEFAVVLRDADLDAAQRFADRIAAALAKPMRIGDRVARVDASIGLAAASAGTDVETLIHRADVAMYAAKAAGRGTIEVFDPAMLDGDRSRVRLEQQLAAAVKDGELLVDYQPVVSLADGLCTGAEALVRWNHPERGLLEPDEFIGVAEHGGAIVDLGAFVLRRACEDAASWHAATGRPLQVYVNVSGRQLADERFIRTVTAALAGTSLPPERLVLELTETALLQSASVGERIVTLAHHGVTIAIDDFGTGYASLTTLRSLPIGAVKIDKSFVARALDGGPDEAVIAAVVQMANHLGIETIAEGVERPEQQRLLERIGARSVQGYLHLRPVPSDELVAWLLAEKAAPRGLDDARAERHSKRSWLPDPALSVTPRTG
jgi:diguanylate cyclase (GGDEF)-like protein